MTLARTMRMRERRKLARCCDRYMYPINFMGVPGAQCSRCGLWELSKPRGPEAAAERAEIARMHRFDEDTVRRWHIMHWLALGIVLSVLWCVACIVIWGAP